MDRVVLDTVVFVRALINPHSASGRLLADYAEHYILLMSKPAAEEIVQVLGRPELTHKFKNLGRMQVRSIIDLLTQAEYVAVQETPRVVRDPGDDMIVATAVAGRADFIVSEDKDLLDLGQVSGIAIVDTLRYLAHLERQARQGDLQA